MHFLGSAGAICVLILFYSSKLLKKASISVGIISQILGPK